MLEFNQADLDALVTSCLGTAPDRVDPMPGGASTRRYFRVFAGGARAVAMFVPDATPEEATSGAAATAEWPFMTVQRLLYERGVRVPRVLGEACKQGLLLIEDLGDTTLAAFVERAPERRAEVYRLAVQDLVKAQRAIEPVLAGSIIATRAFDETLLRWELDHFREWGLDARGLALPGEQRARFDAAADRLARRIASFPRGFVHRDYQSRNLMVLESPATELVWIDFQDALLGPRAYDLVALLCDSYQDIDMPFIEARIDDYAAAAGLDRASRDVLAREVDVITVQRKLKDAGRFVFIDRVKKNPAFLPYIEPSLGKVKRALDRLSDEEDMREISRLVFNQT